MLSSRRIAVPQRYIKSDDCEQRLESPRPIHNTTAWSKLTVTPKGIAEDFAQDLPDDEKQLLTATQGPTAAAVFGATVSTAAWRTKPSWCVIASNDLAVSPELEKAEAVAMKATSITAPPSHVPMLSHPKEVVDLIEQAAAKAESQ